MTTSHSINVVASPREYLKNLSAGYLRAHLYLDIPGKDVL